MPDYMDYEILNDYSTAECRVVEVRMVGEVGGKSYGKDTNLVMNATVDTHDKLAIGIALAVTDYFEACKSEAYRPVETECPRCTGVPLQHGECMVCGYKAGEV
jgi:hypothetical protein